MTRYITLLLFVLLCSGVNGQTANPANPLQTHAKTYAWSAKDSALRYLTIKPADSINYLFPFYQYYQREPVIKQSMGDKNFAATLAVFYTMSGEYRKALEWSEKSYDAADKQDAAQVQMIVNQLKKVQSIDAKAYLTGMALDTRVLMINEAADKPFHRALVFGLLDDLYAAGYRYLAMETLNQLSLAGQKNVDTRTGFHTHEPLNAELVRKAIRLGYTLVPYEDSLAATHSLTQRDSVQAANLYNVIKKDSAAKMIVLAGYGHISEKKIGNDYIPMALAFKMISGIDPLTVDQTIYSEGSTHAVGKLLYDAMVTRMSITETVILLIDRQPIRLVADAGYDLMIVHPPTVYKNNRHTWLSCNGERKGVSFSPQEKRQFIIQAYYEDEYKAGKTEQLIPADQTWIPSDYGYYDLYLRPGKYKIVYRDAGYRVLSVRDKVVNSE